MKTGPSHWGAGMAGLLAWRNLAHDRSRFAVTLVGIIFAVVLIAMQIGLFLGFSDSTTNVIRHTRADFWIVAKGSQNFEVTLPINERELFLARSVPGVAQAEALLVQFTTWKTPGGGTESVIILGTDLNTGLAGPWNIVEGRLEDLRRDLGKFDELVEMLLSRSEAATTPKDRARAMAEIGRVYAHDGAGNIALGRHIGLDTTNCDVACQPGQVVGCDGDAFRLGRDAGVARRAIELGAERRGGDRPAQGMLAPARSDHQNPHVRPRVAPPLLSIECRA